MDIEYLLFLQNWREGMNNALTPFLMGVSDIADKWILLLPVIIYWCINKKNGLFLCLSYGISILLNGLIKLTACVYRPWVREPKIIPAGNAIATAGGYSFPSGHTMTATPVAGGISVLTWKKNKIVSILFMFFIILTMFSRNYLGVHTPQDVIVGLVLGIFAIYISSTIFNYVEKNPEKENFVILIGIIICVISFVYINLKSYPMDYDANGKLLVNPKDMIRSTYSNIGVFSGFLIGRYIEKRFINFSVTGLNFKGIFLAVIGVIIYVLMVLYMKDILVGYLGKFWGRYFNQFVMMFFAIALWPAVLKKFQTC